MNVLIDLTFWRSNQAGGIQTVLLSYLKELEQLQKIYNLKFVVLAYENEVEMLSVKYAGFEYCNLGRRLPVAFREFFEFFFLKFKKQVKNSHCLLSFNYFSYVGLSSKLPLMVMVHDLNHIDIPNTLGFLKASVRRLLVYFSVKKAKFILTVSNFSAARLKEHYKIDNVHVLHNSLSSDFLDRHANVDVLSDKGPIEGKYLLFVGSSHPHKNAKLLIDFLGTSLGEEFKLVIVGQKKKAHNDLISHSEELNVVDQVVFTGYIDADELALYYQSAFAFAFPSKYEGFGIPPLEAMHFSCPVLCSDVASIPEVCGDAVLYFNPDSLSSFELALNALIDGDGIREDLKAKGKLRLANFSWKDSANNLCKLIVQIL